MEGTLFLSSFNSDELILDEYVKGLGGRVPIAYSTSLLFLPFELQMCA